MLRRKVIILSYPFMITLQLIYSIVSRSIRDSIPGLLMLIAYSTLSFLTFRGNKIATWIVIASVLLSGVGSFLIGVFLIPISEVAMKAIFILLGLYFIYGGIELLSGGQR